MTSYSMSMEFKELEPVFNDDYESEELINEANPEIGPPAPTDPSTEIGF